MLLSKDRIATETDLHTFTCEASDLYSVDPDFRRGWPAQIKTDLGNGMPLLRVAKKVDAEGDIIRVRYDQANGCICLYVYND